MYIFGVKNADKIRVGVVFAFYCTVSVCFLFFVLPRPLALGMAILALPVFAFLSAKRTVEVPGQIEFRSASGQLYFAPATKKSGRVAYAICGFYSVLLLLPALGALWANDGALGNVNAWTVVPMLVFLVFYNSQISGSLDFKHIRRSK